MIYFVRHGSTDWNDNVNEFGQVDAKVQGKTDIPLNLKGKMQAKMASEKLANITFDKVFCSPLLRARQTCDIICQNKYPIVYDERLSERSFGIFEGMTRSMFDFSTMWSDDEPKVEGAENRFEFRDRVFSFADEIGKKYPHQNVLVVSHGGVGITLASYFNNSIDPEKYYIPNGTYVQFDYDKIADFEKGN